LQGRRRLSPKLYPACQDAKCILMQKQTRQVFENQAEGEPEAKNQDLTPLCRSELRANVGNGVSRRQSEESWQQFGAATGLPVHLFRLAGIYGPGRSALDISYQVLCKFPVVKGQAGKGIVFGRWRSTIFGAYGAASTPATQRLLLSQHIVLCSASPGKYNRAFL